MWISVLFTFEFRRLAVQINIIDVPETSEAFANAGISGVNREVADKNRTLAGVLTRVIGTWLSATLDRGTAVREANIKISVSLY